MRGAISAVVATIDRGAFDSGAREHVFVLAEGSLVEPGKDEHVSKCKREGRGGEGRPHARMTHHIVTDHFVPDTTGQPVW